MRVRMMIIATAALIGAAVCVNAAERPAEPDSKGCDSGVTLEMIECMALKETFWDKRLNVAYPKALELAQPKQREQLRKTQRAWVAYRDANCMYWRLGEGTIARIEAADCMVTMTKARAEELENIVSSK